VIIDSILLSFLIVITLFYLFDVAKVR